MKITYSSVPVTRSKILNYVIDKKQTGEFRVIDIGGVVNGWTKDIADLVVDIGAESNNSNLKMDICGSWTLLLEYVEQHGMFDYAICTHTLEDVYNPITALELLPKIAKHGIISMPRARIELSHIENRSWLGFIHHRWIFEQVNNQILLIPKLSFLEKLINLGLGYTDNSEEIVYEWDNDIPFIMFMNNYLGPTSGHVIEKYSKFIYQL
jgi:hypothetical protein